MPTLRIRNAANTGWIDGSTAPGFRVRNATNTGWINKTGNLSGVSVRNAAGTGWVALSGGGSVTYAVTPSASTVAEGSSVTFNVSTTGVGSGTLYWTNAGTTTGADFTDGQNSGSVAINSNAGSFTRTLLNDGSTDPNETVIIQLRTGSTSGTVVATASTVTVTEAAPPTQLSLATNSLDFVYLPPTTSGSDTVSNDMRVTVDTSAFYANGGDHIAFALDCQGVQGSNNPHCGPILRRGANLWANARGFIIFGDGTIWAEQWNSTFSPGFKKDMVNGSGVTFNPATTPVFTVRIRAGYRVGFWANTMRIDVYQGTSIYGTLLYSGIASGWGWDWTGSHLASFAAIALDFKEPYKTNCVEEIIPRGAPNAVVGFSNLSLSAY